MKRANDSARKHSDHHVGGRKQSDQDASHPSSLSESLADKRTFQLSSCASSKQYPQRADALHIFRPDRSSCTREQATFPIASREQARRLYAGPTVRAAGAWYSPHDSPGPQVYDEEKLWKIKFRRSPSTRISVSKRERDATPPRTPGPGDYDVSHSSVGFKASTSRLGDPAKRKRYPPRTPAQPIAEVPCSYVEHVSCLQGQLTSDRARSPTFRFSKAPRFQPEDDAVQTPQTIERLASSPAGVTSSIRGSCEGKPANVQRGDKKRRQKQRGGARVFRRGTYGWITASIEPKPWRPRSKITDRRSATTVGDISRSWTLVERAAPRAMLRRGRRYNPSEYDPLQRDLPQGPNATPGPWYEAERIAFERTGGTGGLNAPTVHISPSDRFPKAKLFEEEFVGEREATPGPETYDVMLDHRLEGVACQEMQDSLHLLACLEAVDSPTSPTPLMSADKDGSRWSSDGDSSGDIRVHGEAPESRCQKTEEQSIGLQEECCSRCGGCRQALCSTSASARRWCEAARVDHQHGDPRPCSRVSSATSGTVFAPIPCPVCRYTGEIATAFRFIAAACSCSKENVYRRAWLTGASVRFGEIPRQHSASSSSLGKSERDAAARLLYTPGEIIYKEDRLGRIGPGPSTASPRCGDDATKPRSLAAHVILPLKPRDPQGLSRWTKKGKGANMGAPSEKAVSFEGPSVINGTLGVQVHSNRPTSPSFTISGPRRAPAVFHDAVRYNGQELSQKELCRPICERSVPVSGCRGGISAP